MPQSSQIFIHLACKNTAICKSRAENSGDPDQLASENLNPEHVTIKLIQILKVLEAVHCTPKNRKIRSACHFSHAIVGDSFMGESFQDYS